MLQSAHRRQDDLPCITTSSYSYIARDVQSPTCRGQLYTSQRLAEGLPLPSLWGFPCGVVGQDRFVAAERRTLGAGVVVVLVYAETW